MDARSQILRAIKNSQPSYVERPAAIQFPPPAETFSESLQKVGGSCYQISHIDEMQQHIDSCFPSGITLIRSQLGVAENGAIWVTDNQLLTRAQPFIAEHLAVLINTSNIVATLHDAYDVIGNDNYGYGCFIAGPSKSADIEQSLVLGAHGPLSMTVFLLEATTPA